MDTQELAILLSVVEARIVQLTRQLHNASSRTDLPPYAHIELERKLREARDQKRELQNQHKVRELDKQHGK